MLPELRMVAMEAFRVVGRGGASAGVEA